MSADAPFIPAGIIDLEDAPKTMVGEGLRALRANADGTAAEFYTPNGFYGPVWHYEQKLTITGVASQQTNYPVLLRVYYGAGTNSAGVVYCDSKCETDFSDLRFQNGAGTFYGFWIVEKVNSDYADVWVSIPIIAASPTATTFYMWYGNSDAGEEIRIGLTGDPHYTSTGYSGYPTTTLTWLDNFFTRMGTFDPHVTGMLGDMVSAGSNGALTTDETAIRNKFAGSPGARFVMGGNHDFDYMTLAQWMAVWEAGYPYFKPGKAYGSFDSGGFHFIILDANYNNTTPFEHISTTSYPSVFYVPDGTDGSHNQLGWLRNDLAMTDKPTFVFCHQALSEMGTGWWILSDDLARVGNRAAVRTILEDSGKVIGVFGGHIHNNRWQVINGIPYIHLTVFNKDSGTGIMGTREFPATGTEKSAWAEVTANKGKGTLTIEFYEDDSVEGIRNSTQTFKFCKDKFSEKPQNPYNTFTDFDGGDISNWAGPALVSVAAADIEYRNSLVTESLDGVKFVGRNTATPATVYRSLTAQTAKFKTMFTAGKQETNKECSLQFYNTAGGTTGPYLIFSSGGKIQYHNGTSAVDLQDYTANTAYEFELTVDVAAHTFSISIDGVSKGTGLVFYNATMSSLDAAKVYKPASQDFKFHLDKLRVRKYVSPEPEMD